MNNNREVKDTTLGTILLWLMGVLGAVALVDAFLLSRSVGIWLGL